MRNANERRPLYHPKLALAGLTLSLTLLLSACGTSNNNQAQQTSYKDTKSLVLDILKSSDGQQAIHEASVKASEQMTGIKSLSVTDAQQLQITVKDVLVGSQSSKMLQSVMTDPKFAGEFAKALQQEIKQMHKDLIKDPDYQQSLVSAMKSPEYERIITDTIKGPQYKQQMKIAVQEVLASPLVKPELVKLMKKAVEQELLEPSAEGSNVRGGESGSGNAGSNGGGGGGESGGNSNGGSNKTYGGGDGGGSSGGNPSNDDSKRDSGTSKNDAAPDMPSHESNTTKQNDGQNLDNTSMSGKPKKNPTTR